MDADALLHQVCSLADYPALIDHPLASQIFPSDAIARAKSLVAEIGSTGAYSHSMGVPAIRKRVAQFISGESWCFCRVEPELTVLMVVQSEMGTPRAHPRST